MYKKSLHKNQTYNNTGRKVNSIDVTQLIKRASSLENQPEEYISRHRFSDFNIVKELKRNILNKGYETPSPIQDEAIPLILKGKDVIGIARTGTGKTAAFLLPLINKIILDRKEKVLIIAPTRELASQIQDEFRSFANGLSVYSALCIGGVSIYKQIQDIKRGPHVVIGTPGRLKDLKNQGVLNISSFQNVVLDEVDRMLDMGFIKDMRIILSYLPKERQSLFFSATITPQVTQIIASFSRNTIKVTVKSEDLISSIDQDVILTKGRNKLEVLHDLLMRNEFEKVIIFGRTKWGVEKLSRQLSLRGFSVTAIHGNKNQNQRQRAISAFKNNEKPILLATDIASRGIDVENVTHVINYDLPATYDDYIHRIGRTGRNNKTGVALSFVD